jgi:hypothetical protein
MPYSSQSVINCIDPAIGSTTAIGSAKNTKVYMDVNHPATLYAVGVLITVATADDAATCTVTRRVTTGSDTNATAVDVIHIPLGTAAGKIVYIQLATPVSLNAGDQLSFAFSNNGGNGYWKPWIEAVPREETKANNSDFVASVDA